MTAVPPIPAIMPTPPVPPSPLAGIVGTPATRHTSFTDLLLGGIESTNAKLVEANRLVTAFATDDTIPVHQVTFALEQARQSLELMMQVRGRLLDAYQQFMGMQL